MLSETSILLALGLVAGCAALSAGLILAAWPLLQRYALARPNHRSMHTTPTAQGGGIAIVLSVCLGCWAALASGLANGVDPWRLTLILLAAIALAIIGTLDDLRHLPVAPRLLTQIAAGLMALFALPEGLRVLSETVPWLIERALLLLAIVWFVNLTNFMDGIDWMTVAEVVPITAAIGLFWLLGLVAADAGLLALALLGATLGFAFFNKPVARLFLGDVGSLPIGLLLAWMLVLVAQKSLAAALLLPLYYLMDATITLFRRLLNGENVTQAHRSHFYQRAVAGGASVPAVVARVFAVNIALAALAAVSLLARPDGMDLACFAIGALLTAWLLSAFAKGKA